MEDDIVAGRLRFADQAEFCDTAPWSVFSCRFSRLAAGNLEGVPLASART